VNSGPTSSAWVTIRVRSGHVHLDVFHRAKQKAAPVSWIETGAALSFTNFQF
jgi:hypothetical protein